MQVKNSFVGNCENITGVQLFLSSRCNLSCSYCYISKEKSLFSYDKTVVESLDNGTYAKAIVDLNNITGGNISHLELWGGEPSFNLDSFSKNVPYLFENIPKLNMMIMSSNMTSNIEKIINFLTCLDAREAAKPFTFNLQVSMDGPSFINDITRGGIKNSSDVIINNVKKIINILKLSQTKLNISFKATLPISIINSLCSFNDVFNYFKFWDDLILDLRELIGGKNFISVSDNVVPTIVYPGMYTKEDGIVASQFIRSLGKLARWVSSSYELKTYKKLDMFKIRLNNDGNLDLPRELPFCGAYRSHVALLYTGDIVACHRSFFDLIDSYIDSDRAEINKREVMSESTANRLSIRSRVLNIYDNDFISKFEKTKAQYITSESRIAAIGMLIRAMANIGQVSSIYKDENKALEAALVIRNQNDCTYDNQITTGTISLVEVGLIRLLCNGVIEYLLDKGAGGINIG